MGKRIPQETKENIIRLYDNGNGLTTKEIREITNVSHTSICTLTKLREIINPDTNEPFQSYRELSNFEDKHLKNKSELEYRIHIENSNTKKKKKSKIEDLPNRKKIKEEGYKLRRNNVAGAYSLYVNGTKRIIYDQENDEEISRFDLDEIVNKRVFHTTNDSEPNKITWTA